MTDEATQAEDYRYLFGIAQQLGYPSVLEALEAIPAADEITRLNALVDEMREGLEPFAKAADTIDQPWRGNIPREKDSAVAHYTGITLGDFRRARALITKASRDSGHG